MHEHNVNYSNYCKGAAPGTGIRHRGRYTQMSLGFDNISYIPREDTTFNIFQPATARQTLYAKNTESLQPVQNSSSHDRAEIEKRTVRCPYVGQGSRDLWNKTFTNNRN